MAEPTPITSLTELSQLVSKQIEEAVDANRKLMVIVFSAADGAPTNMNRNTYQFPREAYADCQKLLNEDIDRELGAPPAKELEEAAPVPTVNLFEGD